jgi:hypothetical protein
MVLMGVVRHGVGVVFSVNSVVLKLQSNHDVCYC